MFRITRQLIKKTNKSPKVKGFIGEKYAHGYLSKYPFKLHNIQIEKPTKTQIDHIVICDKGIIVIETKNYTGIIKGNVKDNYWYQYTNRKENRFINPIKQNEFHIDTLKKVFPQYKDLFISIILFMPKAKIVIDNKSNVVFLNHLKTYIFNLPSMNLDLSKQETIYNNINKTLKM